MHDFTLLKEVIIILVVSLPFLFLCKKLNISTIVGFIVAGILIGPSALAIITKTSEIQFLAEIGVILLLFYIGLEFSVEKLIKMKQLLLVAGGMQVGFTTAISTLIFCMLDFPCNQAIFFGLLISFSSTAIVLKIFSDRDEMSTPHGKISLGVLLFQDIAIVPVLIFLPLIGSTGDISTTAILTKVGISFGFVAVIIVLSRVLVPRLFYYLAALRVREVFTIGIILLVFGTAYLTEIIGLTLGIGAFIAGIIISESDYAHQIVAEILPFKDVFNSIFFISIGMLVNLSIVFEAPLLVILLIPSILLLKGLIIFFVVKAMKYPVRVGLIAGLSLSQVGEFSFLIAQAGFGYDLLTPTLFNIFLASSIVTMILTPFMIQYSHKVADMLRFFDKVKPTTAEKKAESISNHVIIAGYGLNGKNVSSVLKETGIPYYIIEMNPQTVRRCSKAGENIVYGDITKKEVLHKAYIHKANVMVIAISDPYATRMAITQAKEMSPNLKIIARTRFLSNVEELTQLGADTVIPEEFETSLQIFSKVLSHYHVPLNVIMKQVALLREESYSMLRKTETEEIHRLTHLDEVLQAGLVETYFVSEENPCTNTSLAEMNLRARTGATIISIVRKGATITNPEPTERLLPGDTVVLTGKHYAIDAAIQVFEEMKCIENNENTEETNEKDK